MSKQPTEPRFVICVENGDSRASLEVRKLYQVVPDPVAAAHGLLRVIDESGDDSLYPLHYFAAVDLPKPLEVVLLKAS